MSVLDSLPDRPLDDAELAGLNRADALDLAVDVSEGDGDDGIAGLLLATEHWVKGLAYGTDGWRVVETEPVDGDEGRFDAMRACEDAVRADRDVGE